MSDTVFNPILHFLKDARPESIMGGGKSQNSIISSRLEEQRFKLSETFHHLSEKVNTCPNFNNKIVLHASMYDDSLAPSYTPYDLFPQSRNVNFLTPFRSGYLVQAPITELELLAEDVKTTRSVKRLVDISRVESVRFFDKEDAINLESFNNVWDQALEDDQGKYFAVWLMPLNGDVENKILKERFKEICEELRINFTVDGDPFSVINGMDDKRHVPTTLCVSSQDRLIELVTSGTTFRIDPIQPISSTSPPGDGSEPMRPIPNEIIHQPIVGIVDGGCTAASYQLAEAWREPNFVNDNEADHKHGNQVTSLVVHGYGWNNNLSLPKLDCRFGVLQAVPKHGTTKFLSNEQLISSLETAIQNHPDTHVWNFSFNEPGSCSYDQVSYLGHSLAELARKYSVLPIISVGNSPGSSIKPPADCEAAITVGGRLHDKKGMPTGECPISLNGPGPSYMLKPEISNFSHVRVLGGAQTKGSSFSTALTSPIAAHTMNKLQEPTPDLVKALLIHHSDTSSYDPGSGFGVPNSEFLPWECQPGFVTMFWKASLRTNTKYYWELPIPPSIIKDGKLWGQGVLTAILNPSPLCSILAGSNYFSARLETALQYYDRNGKAQNLLGTMSVGKIKEQDARKQEHKWSPVRHHRKNFKGKGFNGNSLRVYARTFARDLYLYNFINNVEEIPALDVVFVLSLGTGNLDDDTYNEMRNHLGNFVEMGVVETQVELNTDDDIYT